MIILSYFNDLSTTAFYFIFFYQQTLPSVFKNKQLFMQLILTKVRAYLYRGNYKVSPCQYIYLQCKLNIMSLPQKFYLWRQITNFDWKLSFVGCFAVVNRRETFLLLIFPGSVDTMNKNFGFSCHWKIRWRFPLKISFSWRKIQM